MVLIFVIVLVILGIVGGSFVSSSIEKKNKTILALEQRIHRHNDWLRSLETKEPLLIAEEVRNVVRRGGP